MNIRHCPKYRGGGVNRDLKYISIHAIRLKYLLCWVSTQEEMKLKSRLISQWKNKMVHKGRKIGSLTYVVYFGLMLIREIFPSCHQEKWCVRCIWIRWIHIKEFSIAQHLFIKQKSVTESVPSVDIKHRSKWVRYIKEGPGMTMNLTMVYCQGPAQYWFTLVTSSVQYK